MTIQAAASRPVIHLVNPLWGAESGSERRTLALWELLRECADVHLWSPDEPADSIDAAYPVRRLRPWRGSFPRGGTIVLVGVYFRLGHWIRLARPRRVVVIYNSDQPDRLDKVLRRLAGCGARIDVVSTSPILARRLGRNLPVLESPILLAPFVRNAAHADRPFTVGRLSRDDETKHHREDPLLYRRLAESGCVVRIMGGTCLAAMLAGTANIELLPAGAESAAAFLGSLDCFIYRTSEGWLEAFGRVIFEAMASGLPVVCARIGGYVDYLTHGRDSFIFEDTTEAYERIQQLRGDVALRATLGEAARVTARDVVGEKLYRRTREYLLETD